MKAQQKESELNNTIKEHGFTYLSHTGYYGDFMFTKEIYT